MNWLASLNAPKYRPWWIGGSSIAVVSLFLFTRFFALHDGLFFLNDMGRDFLVLWEWLQTGKPPLLGPQNSVLPFNQSALYFYWLMPGYILSGQSYYASVLTLASTYIAFFSWGMWKLRHHRWWPGVLLIFGWLITLHPTSIEQNRFVWNPSFLAPFLVFTLVSLWQYRASRNWKWLALFGTGTGISLAFSYSLIPIFIALAAAIVALEKRQSWKLILSMTVGTVVTQLPTLAFELRHRFVLTTAVINWVKNGATPDGTGTHFTASQKIADLFLHTLGTPETHWQWLIGGFFVTSIIIYSWQLWKKKEPHSTQEKLFIFLTTVLWLTIALTLLLPIGVHAHYIFGIATLVFLVVAVLPAWGKWPLLIGTTIIWLLPGNFLPHFAQAPRTVDQMVLCARTVCAQHPEPVFSSIESGILPFHNGPDWRYMFASNGCQLQNLEAFPESADTMLVVAEKTTYTHNETKFNELSIFGPSREEQVYTCQEDIRVHVLERTADK